MRGRTLGASLLFVALFMLLPAGAYGSTARRDFGPMGVVPPHVRGAHVASAADTFSKTARRRRANLAYHHGRILPNSTTHLLFWDPSGGFTFPAGYKSAITKYFEDVATDSAVQATTNAYSVAAQYYDRNLNGTINNHSKYNVTGSGHSERTDGLSPNCPAHSTTSSFSMCVNDYQIENVVSAVFPSPGANDIYFVFLPPGVDTCAGSLGCFGHPDFCAYHSGFSDGTHLWLYANEPYGEQFTSGLGCLTDTAPVGFHADATINTASHEHIETITDPTGYGWWSSRTGAEIADKCAYRYGSYTGDHNQTINGQGYLLQMEWSNAARRCKQHVG